MQQKQSEVIVISVNYYMRIFLMLELHMIVLSHVLIITKIVIILRKMQVLFKTSYTMKNIFSFLVIIFSLIFGIAKRHDDFVLCQPYSLGE